MDTREQVEHVLKNYHEIKRRMDILDFEIKRFIVLNCYRSGYPIQSSAS